MTEFNTVIVLNNGLRLVLLVNSDSEILITYNVNNDSFDCKSLTSDNNISLTYMESFIDECKNQRNILGRVSSKK